VSPTHDHGMSGVLLLRLLVALLIMIHLCSDSFVFVGRFVVAMVS